MSRNKPEPKKQEQPAEQTTPIVAKPGGIEPGTSTTPENIQRAAPLAAHPPDLQDRVAALERANIELEFLIKEHIRYHFGKA